MGVFTVGRQVALEIPMPGWWLANASVDMDFRRGLYYDSSTANPRAATDFLSCIRASVGYAKNADGTLTQFASNVLRIGNGTGLLVEDARINIQTQSEDFSTGAWGAPLSTLTVTTDQAVAPNGTTTMDKLDDGTSFDRHFATGNPSITANTTYTFSVFAKDIDRRYVHLNMTAGGGAGAIYCYADLQTGTITDSGVATAGTGTVFTSATIEAFANSTYRVSLTGITNSSTTGLFSLICMSDRATQPGNLSNGCPQYTGTNKSLYVWGGQLEASAFPSSYIPTTTVGVTRAADNITTSGALQTVINNATASLVAQTDNGGAAGIAANIVDSNGTNLLGFNSSNNALASMIGTLATANTANRTTQDKLGIAWSGAGRSLVLNGGTVATDASAQTPSATQHIGSSGSANFAYAYVERLSTWTTKIADATLQGFTV